MSVQPEESGKKRESIYLSERFMAFSCAVAAAAGLASLYFSVAAQDSFVVFEVLAKLVTPFPCIWRSASINGTWPRG